MTRLHSCPPRPHASCCPALAITVLFSSGCGEPLPDIPLDIADHDRCSMSVPYVVDASASEIQCLVEDYLYVSDADGFNPIMEEGTNVPGIPACCEVCAVEDTADDACEAMCKHQLCERAQDEHYAIGEDLGECEGSSCGFSFESCMSTGLLHVQWIDLDGVDFPNDPSYGLRAQCQASALDPVRPDGLFRYLEGLGAIPGAGGGLASVEDVVGYCQDKVRSDTDGGTNHPGDAGADSGTSGTESGGDTSEPPPRPPGCGSHAEPRFWVRPTNNFGAWNHESTGLGIDGETSYPIPVTDGGLAYTMLPCPGADDSHCLRIDQLAVELSHPSEALVVSLGLVEQSMLMPLSPAGRFDVPPSALRFAVRYEHDDRETLAMAWNHEAVRGHVDAQGGLLRLPGISASSGDGTALATVSLHATLVNTQPSTTIHQSAGAAWNRVSLSAQTFDAESDPITHQWMIPGVGTWRADRIEVELPAGRHVVILRADDIHRSRGIAAQWIDVRPEGT